MTRTALAGALLTVVLLWTGSALAQLATMEQQAMRDTFQYALENTPSNQAADWVNPDTDHAGAVVPMRTFSDGQGRPCREFLTTISIGGEQQQGYGTACRKPDGTWQIVSDRQPAATTKVAKRPTYVYHPAERYYVYPHAYYTPSPIYFSFSWLFHGGRLHIGNYYPEPVWPLHRPVTVKPYLYAPLPHGQWYRNEHIRRSWKHPDKRPWSNPELRHSNRPLHQR